LPPPACAKQPLAHALARPIYIYMHYIHDILFKRAEHSMSMASIYSSASSISLDRNDAGYRTLAGFVVLKILFWDIGSSLGDTVTDFLQGFNLIFDWMAVDWWKLRPDTEIYGINCGPGIVAIIHIISHYRYSFFFSSRL
jgi:hypothetical protein